MGSMKTVIGDVTNPQSDSSKPIIITHVCNDLGAWGAGFVLAINKAFGTDAMNKYKTWCTDGESDGIPFRLGQVQFVVADKNKQITVANMIGQEGIGFSADNRPPIRYGHLALAMFRVGQYAGACGAEIHTPMFGAGLAGGNWDFISEIIQEIWVDKYGLDVTIYEFQPATTEED